MVFSLPPERRFGGIGRRARLKIEYLRVWVRVPQPLFSEQARSLRGSCFLLECGFLTRLRALRVLLLPRENGFAV